MTRKPAPSGMALLLLTGHLQIGFPFWKLGDADPIKYTWPSKPPRPLSAGPALTINFIQAYDWASRRLSPLLGSESVGWTPASCPGRTPARGRYLPTWNPFSHASFLTAAAPAQGMDLSPEGRWQIGFFFLMGCPHSIFSASAFFCYLAVSWHPETESGRFPAPPLGRALAFPRPLPVLDWRLRLGKPALAVDGLQLRGRVLRYCCLFLFPLSSLPRWRGTRGLYQSAGKMFGGRGGGFGAGIRLPQR